MSNGAPPSVRFGRRSTRGMILGLSTSRALVLTLATMVAVVALFVGGTRAFALSSFLWAPMFTLVFGRIAGRPMLEWSGTAAHYGARRLSSQHEYRARVARPRPAGTLALPGDGAAVRVYLDEASGAAMLHDPHRATLAVVASVRHPSFVLLDDDERAQRVASWGRTLAGLAPSGTCAAIQVLEATIPDPAKGQLAWWEEHGSDGEGFAEAQYAALLDQVRLDASTHRTTITISIDLKKAMRSNRSSSRALSGAASLLRGEMAGLSESLRQAGITCSGFLGEVELAAILRQAFDPGAELDATDPGARLEHAGPLAITESWDHLRHDSGYSSVLWISEWPRIEVPVDFLHPLVFAPGVRRCLSLIARPLPTEVALRQLRRERTDAATDSAQKARLGQLAELADQQAYEDLLERERSVISGHADVEFTGLVSVTAATLEDLERARQSIVRAAGQAACEVRPLYGRQLQGFLLAALPLGRSAFR
jgi:hypothetical protein